MTPAQNKKPGRAYFFQMRIFQEPRIPNCSAQSRQAQFSKMKNVPRQFLYT